MLILPNSLPTSPCSACGTVGSLRGTAYGIECAFCGKKVRRGHTVSPIRSVSPDSASQDAYPLHAPCFEDIEDECYFYRNICHHGKAQ